jgi:DNA-binding NtrC family response regulator
MTVKLLETLASLEPQKETRIRVLIVDDDVTVRKLWGEVLQSSCKVCYGSTPAEAISEINSEEKPEILILDWLLLNGNASTVLDFWMSNVGGPCCIISGGIDPDDRVNFYRRGVMHVLEKPLHIGIFNSVINHYIGIVKSKNEIGWLKKEVAKLKRQQILLFALVFILVGGQELIPYLVKLFA